MIEAAQRLLTEIRQADAWIARELEAISPGGEAMRGPRGGRLGLGRATSRSQGRLTETRPPATAMRNARRFITHSRLAMSTRRDRARRPAGSTLLQPSHVRELPTAPARLFCRPWSRPAGPTSRAARSLLPVSALRPGRRLEVQEFPRREPQALGPVTVPRRDLRELVWARARDHPPHRWCLATKASKALRASGMGRETSITTVDG